MVFAQSPLQAVTETYNSAINANEAGNMEMALSGFNEALAQAEALGAEGAEIATNCKNSIPILMFAIAKKAVNEANYDKAVEGLRETIAVAAKFGNENIEADAKSLVPQVLMQKANGFFNEKKMAEACEGYKEVIAEDPNNGNAYLRLGAALKAIGDKDGAVEAFKSAIENGQEKAASNQLSNMFQKEAAENLKAKKFDEAIASALEATKYLESPKAYQLAGTAATYAGKNKQAIEYFEKYLELAPDAKNTGDILFSIAVAYQKLGDKAKAKELYQLASENPAKINPKNLEAAKQQIAAIK